VENALTSSNFIQVITLSVKSGSKADSILELLAPGSVLLLEEVVEVFVLSFLIFVNFSIIRNNFNETDVLLSNGNTSRARTFKLNLEDQLFIFLLFFFISIFLLFSVYGSLGLVFSIVNE